MLGGTSLFGGEGGIKNTALGLLIFAFLSNGLNLLPWVDIYFKEALQGIILVVALVLNVIALRLEKVQIQTSNPNAGFGGLPWSTELTWNAYPTTLPGAVSDFRATASIMLATKPKTETENSKT